MARPRKYPIFQPVGEPVPVAVTRAPEPTQGMAMLAGILEKQRVVREIEIRRDRAQAALATVAAELDQAQAELEQGWAELHKWAVRQ